VRFLLAQVQDYPIAFHRSSYDGSCRSTNSVTLKNHPKPLKRGLILPLENYLPTPLIELSNLHFASENVGHGFFDFLGVLSRPDFRFAMDEEAQFRSNFSRRAVRLLRSFFVSSFSTTRSAMAMSFPTPTFSSLSSRSRKSAQFLGRSDLPLFSSLWNLLFGEAWIAMVKTLYFLFSSSISSMFLAPS